MLHLVTCDAFDSLFTVKSPPVNSRQPDGLTSIGGGAFISCTSLALTRLPDGLTHIGDRAFKECTGISRSTLKKSDGRRLSRKVAARIGLPVACECCFLCF